MKDKNTNNKNSLNNNIVNIVTLISLIVMICIIVLSFIIWQKTNNLASIIFGVLGIFGVLLNIYLLSKEKSKKE